MSAVSDPKLTRQESIADYKTILRDAINQRPSGIRQKIAQALGTHKSFISQITNPSDTTPIPARHLDAIIDVCHLSPGERSRFLEAYYKAHPEARRLAPGSSENEPLHYKTLHLQIPVLRNARQQQAFEAFIRDTVRRLYTLMRHSEPIEEKSDL